MWTHGSKLGAQKQVSGAEPRVVAAANNLKVNGVEEEKEGEIESEKALSGKTVGDTCHTNSPSSSKRRRLDLTTSSSSAADTGITNHESDGNEGDEQGAQKEEEGGGRKGESELKTGLSSSSLTETKPSSVTPRSTPTTDDRAPSAVIASKCQTSTLFVGSLHPRITDAHLHKLFQPYGSINRVHICTHSLHDERNAGKPKGYAFVEYTTIDSARLAIMKLDGRTLLGRALVVRPAHDKTGGTTGASTDSMDGTAAAGVKGSSDPRLLRKEKTEIESKMEAVKRAIEEKKRKQQQQQQAGGSAMGGKKRNVFQR